MATIPNQWFRYVFDVKASRRPPDQIVVFGQLILVTISEVLKYSSFSHDRRVTYCFLKEQCGPYRCFRAWPTDDPGYTQAELGKPASA
jgi:hypothetical protein